jgi:hypothetical protein
MLKNKIEKINSIKKRLENDLGILGLTRQNCHSSHETKITSYKTNHEV